MEDKPKGRARGRARGAPPASQQLIPPGAAGAQAAGGAQVRNR